MPLQDWCEKVEKFLAEKEEDHIDSKSSIGPMTELEFWRQRMQLLNSVP